MNKYNIELRKISFAYQNSNKESNIILIEGVKNGRRVLKRISPLFVNNSAGIYI